MLMFSKTTSLILTVPCIVFCIGCGTQTETQESSSAVEQSLSPDALDGRSFVSEKKHEVGLRPDGVEAMGHWRIAFTGGQFDWEFSDASTGGPYKLATDGTISDGNRGGFFDAKKDRLQWDGVWSVPE